MSKKSLLVLSVTLIGILMATSCASEPSQFYNNGVTDAEYVSIASNAQIAGFFLEKYPQAEILVDRSGWLAVDFRVSKHPITSTAQSWQGIRLRVFIDPKTNQPTESFIQCDNKFVREKVKQYLEQYSETQSCP